MSTPRYLIFFKKPEGCSTVPLNDLMRDIDNLRDFLLEAYVNSYNACNLFSFTDLKRSKVNVKKFDKGSVLTVLEGEWNHTEVENIGAGLERAYDALKYFEKNYPEYNNVKSFHPSQSTDFRNNKKDSNSNDLILVHGSDKNKPEIRCEIFDSNNPHPRTKEKKDLVSLGAINSDLSYREFSNHKLFLVVSSTWKWGKTKWNRPLEYYVDKENSTQIIELKRVDKKGQKEDIL